MPTLPTTLEAAACEMEGPTNGAQEHLIKAYLKNQRFNLPEGKREALNRQAWSSIVQIVICNILAISSQGLVKDLVTIIKIYKDWICSDKATSEHKYSILYNQTK